MTRYQRIARKIKKEVVYYTSLFISMIKYTRDLVQIKKQAALSDVQFPITKLYPCFADSNDEAGVARGHYFHQDLFVAQRIYINNPVKHVDVGSRIDGFVAHIAAFREIEILDIRPMHNQIQNICVKQADLMKDNDELTDYTDSISCLHALEHFGLGRYGDTICFEGYLLGLKNITRILKRGGKFYFSVPFGKQRIEFHAHRIFSLKYLMEILSPSYRVDSLSYVDDLGDFHANIQILPEHLADNLKCKHGCAIFELTKK